jgi:flagellar biogenesis protein FliO
MHPVTYEGLHKWTVKSYEKLGWMILMLKYNNALKIKDYLESLDRLKQAIEDKIQIIKEEDRRVDLGILLEQVNYLIDFANTNLKAAIESSPELKSAFGNRRR